MLRLIEQCCVQSHVKIAALLAVSLCIAACGESKASRSKMSDEWCETMMQTANQAWTEEQAKLFARDCLYNDQQ